MHEGCAVEVQNCFPTNLKLGQFLARAWESIEIEKGRREGRWYFVTFRFGPIGPIKNKQRQFLSVSSFFSILIQLGDLIYRGFEFIANGATLFL